MVTFNLNQIFADEAPAFFIDGFWVDNSIVSVHIVSIWSYLLVIEASLPLYSVL